MDTTAKTTKNAPRIFAVAPLEEFKESEVKEGQVLVRKIERGGKISKYAVIPAVDQDTLVLALEEPAIFNAALQWYQGLVIELAKTAVGKIEKKGKIDSSEFGLAAIVETLEAIELQDGLSAARIKLWFDDTLATALKAAFIAKLGSLPDDKLEEIINSYRLVFLAIGSKDKIKEQAQTSAKKALGLIPSSAITKYFLRLLNEQNKGIDVEAL